MLLKGGEHESSLSRRVDQSREQINDTSSKYENEILQVRMARLASRVTVLMIGGSSDIAFNERKDVVTNAFN